MDRFAFKIALAKEKRVKPKTYPGKRDGIWTAPAKELIRLYEMNGNAPAEERQCVVFMVPPGTSNPNAMRQRVQYGLGPEVMRQTKDRPEGKLSVDARLTEDDLEVRVFACPVKAPLGRAITLKRKDSAEEEAEAAVADFPAT